MAPVAAPAQVSLSNSSVSMLKSQNGNSVDGQIEYQVAEDYEGNYQFAPIKEHQVSRAMTKRYALSPCLSIGTNSQSY